jgi:uncharacterized membrane protein
MSQDDISIAGLGKSRVEALTDGIFATVMIVLVLSLSVPVISASLVSSELGIDLTSLVPIVLSYIISFVVIGVYWVGHHAVFHFIRRTNRVLIWLNMLFLLCVGFIPFSAALIGRYPLQQITSVIYGLNLIAASLTLYVVFWYSTTHRRLMDKNFHEHMRILARRRLLVGPLVYLVAILVSFVDTRISLALYATTPIYYILPGKIDIHFATHSLTPQERT